MCNSPFFLMYAIFCAPNFAKLFFSEVMSRLFLCGNLLPFASSLAFFNANLQDLMQDVAFSFANRYKCLRNIKALQRLFRLHELR